MSLGPQLNGGPSLEKSSHLIQLISDDFKDPVTSTPTPVPSDPSTYSKFTHLIGSPSNVGTSICRDELCSVGWDGSEGTGVGVDVTGSLKSSLMSWIRWLDFSFSTAM